MKLVYIYLMICVGMIRFGSQLLGQDDVYLRYVPYVLLVGSSLCCIYLFLRRKIVITNLTLVMAAYITLRLIAVSSFAVFHEYNLWDYIYPIKNWILLLNLFIIGQSLVLSEEAVNSLIMKALSITVLILLFLEILGFFAPKFGPLFQLQSRVPILKYRFNIDEFIIVYVYLLISLKMLKNELAVRKYLSGAILLLLAVAICQTKQVLVAIFVVSLFLIMKKYRPYLTKAKVIYAVFFFVLTSALISGMYFFVTTARVDTAFSVWRRKVELEYAWDRASAYPVFGYPIPTNLFGWTMPKDIIHYFYGFDPDVTLFPSDLPIPFILTEEGVVGLLFVVVFLIFAYKKNPEKVSYVLIVLLSLIGSFRMYYMIPVQSSFTYFLLGLLTRPAAKDSRL